jgi:hypothetical protein
MIAAHARHMAKVHASLVLAILAAGPAAMAADGRTPAPVSRPEVRAPAPAPAPVARPAWSGQHREVPATSGQGRTRGSGGNARSLDLFIRNDEPRSGAPDRR